MMSNIGVSNVTFKDFMPNNVMPNRILRGRFTTMDNPLYPWMIVNVLVSTIGQPIYIRSGKVYQIIVAVSTQTNMQGI